MKKANDHVTIKTTLAMPLKLISDIAKAVFIVTCSLVFSLYDRGQQAGPV